LVCEEGMSGVTQSLFNFDLKGGVSRLASGRFGPISERSVSTLWALPAFLMFNAPQSITGAS